MTTIDLMNRYTIIAFLATGTKGIVYRVEDKQTGAQVALKIYPDDNGAAKDIYDKLKKYQGIPFVQPIDWYYLETYPTGYAMPPSEKAKGAWRGYTMQCYQTFRLCTISDRLVVDFLRGYAYAQIKTGFCQRGNISNNLLSDGQKIILIDLDECRFSYDPLVQVSDSNDILDSFDFVNNSQNRKRLLEVLKGKHTSRWDKYLPRENKELRYFLQE